MSFIRVSSVFICGYFSCLLTLNIGSVNHSVAADFLGRSFEQWSDMLNSSQQAERTYAAWAIGKLAEQSAGSPNDQVYFAELVKLVNDNDPSVRFWGVLGLSGYAQKLPAKDGGQ